MLSTLQSVGTVGCLALLTKDCLQKQFRCRHHLDVSLPSSLTVGFQPGWYQLKGARQTCSGIFLELTTRLDCYLAASYDRELNARETLFDSSPDCLEVPSQQSEEAGVCYQCCVRAPPIQNRVPFPNSLADPRSVDFKQAFNLLLSSIVS